jgi:hypothetical protein
MFLDFGSGRAIVGYVDPAELDFTGGRITSARPSEKTVGGCGSDGLWRNYAGFRGFVARLLYDWADFDRIARVELGTPTGRMVETPFDPPRDVSGLWLSVP